MYRAYDTVKNKWVSDVYMSPNPFSNLYIFKKNIFGKNKLIVADPNRYVVHKEIGIDDKYDTSIYEGDIIKAETADGKKFIGLVAYAHEFAAYVVFRYNPDEYYVLGSDISSNIEVIGNVFDNSDLLPVDLFTESNEEQYGSEQTL